MKTNFIVKPEAEGTNNGKPYRGLVIATRGKEKAIAFAYLPDVFNEEFGRTLAELKLKQKLIRRKQVKINQETAWRMRKLDHDLLWLSVLHGRELKCFEQIRKVQRTIDDLLD